jgi:toxin-antitoxin system PIN domain toxin
MIAVDTNILVAAHREEAPLHKAALKAVRSLAEGDTAWALPVFCVGEFIRVVSHDRVFDPPTPVTEAVAVIDALLASPSARLLMPGDRFLSILKATLKQSAVRGNLVFDGQIAALCREHGATTLLTEDRDFSRFEGLTITTLASFVAT